VKYDLVFRASGATEESLMRRTTAVLALALSLGAASPATAQPALVLATTTSTQDSGLLDDLLPRFEKATGIRVKTIAVGSGEAIAMGRRGDADVLLVHSKAAEDEFMVEGHGALRLDVMYNDFVLVGPPSDPAGVRGLPVAEAMKRLAEKGARFASRDDRSGTHARELALWQQAGIDPAGKPWYVATGQGMGETARVASEKRACTLADRGTFLALAKSLDLAVLVEGSPELRNSYRVIVVSRQKHPKARAAEARRFAEWLVSPGTQKAIGAFGVAKFGQPLFVPDAKKE
jgi:tungstate transport system substrate-binding protein